MSKWSAAVLLALITLVQPVSARAQDSRAYVADDIILREVFEPALNTFSGAHQHRISTSQLFSAFQLVSMEGSEKVDHRALHHGPIVLPAEIGDDPFNGMDFCTEFRTINGYYTAFNEGTGLSTAPPDSNKTAQGNPTPNVAAFSPLTLRTADQGELKWDFAEDHMLMRAYLSPDCQSGVPPLFVPIATKNDVTNLQLIAVFEVGNAEIAANLWGVPVADLRQKFGDKPAQAFKCEPTRRLNVGFDCSLEMKDLQAWAAGQDETKVQMNLFRLELSITFPGQRKPEIFPTLIALPATH